MEPDQAQVEDDAQLLRAHAGGDAQAFARLYDRYDRPCFQFIRRTLGGAHADAAEDLHQETWIAVSRGAGAFDPARGSFVKGGILAMRVDQDVCIDGNQPPRPS